ncbi:hypothetical protein J5N97_002432 [Dioscorea zingiberensis]|uniref:Uncharacterized protein n=1 Tax=Dioscorea zingiberensis TaxID=325984 RepID=A0A9D5HPL8_9LILI|nr:hypothetical protein J5N97_002432 [Dioscorea zingiberensis]
MQYMLAVGHSGLRQCPRVDNKPQDQRCNSKSTVEWKVFFVTALILRFSWNVSCLDPRNQEVVVSPLLPAHAREKATCPRMRKQL